ncbi:hypothetical protein [Cereibacter sphaeroides]|uniref:hypothetical protein n=1 Tax=Cereibacter sphaeroides TaxID=1063 RepID=UPI001F3950F1|nr:hypothetical protein [Cereibacter sphaeroides]MCE6967140.1 hypothetical protein [Cereibacter sphaeroides]
MTYVTRTYVVDQNPIAAVILPAQRLGLPSGRIFLLADYDHCWVQCRSDVDITLIHLLLSGSDLPCRVVQVEDGIIAPELWRDEIADVIAASPHHACARVLSVCDLSLRAAEDHDRLVKEIKARGHYVDVHPSA